MKTAKRRSGWWCIVGLLWWVAATPARASDRPPLLVFAAASLQQALDAVVEDWAQRGGAEVVVSYAGSQLLARQIEQGAPADLFISADQRWMDHLAQQSLMRVGSLRPLLGNALVLVVPRSSAASALELKPGVDLSAWLALGERIAVCDPAVPAGRYAQQALSWLGRWPELQSRTTGADNVRTALLQVARAEAPLGVVYASDAQAEPAVRVVAQFPAQAHDPIVYPLAQLAESTHPQAAALADYLLSAPAQAIFAGHGFVAAAQ